MIQNKVKAFKNEIRKRGQLKHMERVRYMSWLEENLTYEASVERFLYLVAASKLHSNQPSLSCFRELTQFLADCCRDWNVYILISQQVIQLDLVTLVCSQIGDVKLVCEVIQALIIRPIQDINNWLLAQIVKEVRDRVLEKFSHCAQIRLTHELANHLSVLPLKNSRKLHNFNSSHCLSRLQNFAGRDQLCLQHLDLRTIDDIVKAIAWLSRERQIKDIYQHRLDISQSLIKQFVLYVHQSVNKFSHELLFNYLQVLKILNTQAQSGKKITTADDQEQRKQLIKETNGNILDILSALLTKQDRNMFEGAQNSQLCLQLLQQIEVSSAEYMPVIQAAFQKMSQYHSQLIATRHCLEVLNKICYQEKWVCYSHFRYYLIKVMQSSKIHYQQAHNPNIFQTLPFQAIGSKQETLITTQTLLISTMSSLLKNQYIHQCHYDYHQVLQQLLHDILSTKVLEHWCSHWKVTESFEILVCELVNCRNQKLKLELLIVCRHLLQLGHVRKGIQRKLLLYYELYMLDHQDCLTEELFEHNTCDSGSQDSGYDSFS